MTAHIKIYVEGGGERSRLKTECRKGFRLFFQKAGLSGMMPAIVACGSRNNAYQDFCTALRSSGTGVLPLLLVDSEGPVHTSSAWQHLEDRDNWERPARADEDHVHLMVQCMESWFLADPVAVAAFFGPGFAVHRLPKNARIEEVPKQQVLGGLKAATRSTISAAYSKGRQSFSLLASIDPLKVQHASAWAKRLVDRVTSAKAPIG